MGETVAIDFFTVATIRLRVLFVFLVMEHGREECCISESRSIRRQNGRAMLK